MDSEELYSKLMNYFPKNLDLMRHLNVNACWEYFVNENSTNNDEVKIHYFLYKKNEESLEMTKESPNIEPDLILYFTEKAILELIKGSPSAEEYYNRYRKIMNNPKLNIQVDNKINKPRLKLWRLGYKQWQKEFNF